MPCRARARLKRYARARDPDGRGRGVQPVEADISCELVCGSFLRCQRTGAFQFHGGYLSNERQSNVFLKSGAQLPIA